MVMPPTQGTEGADASAGAPATPAKAASSAMAATPAKAAIIPPPAPLPEETIAGVVIGSPEHLRSVSTKGRFTPANLGRQLKALGYRTSSGGFIDAESLLITAILNIAASTQMCCFYKHAHA